MNYTWKLIVQPQLVAAVRDVHELIFHSGYYLVDEKYRPRSSHVSRNVERSYSIFRLHHYFTRSLLDWWKRVQRGAVSGIIKRYRFEDVKRFEHMNAIKDTVAFEFVDTLKERLEWNGTEWLNEHFPSESVPLFLRNMSLSSGSIPT